MTDLVLPETVWAALTEILEKMFFIDTTDVEADGCRMAPDEDCVTAGLTFEGDPPGRLWIRLSNEAARALAADFLGEEPSGLPAQKMEAVVCELANMICGSVLSRVESMTDFRLAAPRIVPDGSAPLAMVSQTVPLTGGWLTVGLTMESTAWPATEKYGS